MMHFDLKTAHGWKDPSKLLWCSVRLRLHNSSSKILGFPVCQGTDKKKKFVGKDDVTSYDIITGVEPTPVWSLLASEAVLTP